MSTVPLRTREQVLDALASANEVRMARAGWRREMHELPVDVTLDSAARLVLDPPRWARGLGAARFLATLPRLGPTRDRRRDEAGRAEAAA